ncbi:MAG: hypothetical protein HGA86_04265 [Anaerolineaceae bacterium]|nr:hypothetical protein [Anaerolineaceae bacterium]
MFLIWLGLASNRVILPTETFIDRYRAAWHLIMFIFNRHGPGVVVKNGTQQTVSESMNRIGAGFVVADFNSGVVLEEQIEPPSLTRPIWQLLDRMMVALFLRDRKQSPRVVGAGLTFTRPRERIRGVVDLRKQFGLRLTNSTYSREGIELTANVWTMFTVGQDADVLDVTFTREPINRNLRVITLQEVGTDQVKVIQLTDELDEADTREVAPQMLMALRTNAGAMVPYTKISSPFDPKPVYDPMRVFSALGGRAWNSENEIVPWNDLPSRVAVDYFREMVSKTNYDLLYEQNAERERPRLFQMRAEFRRLMHNSGILSYRLLYHKDHIPLRVGVAYNRADILVSEVRAFTGSKVLRDRGLKVIAAGFGDLIPPDAVYKQRLENWRAPWQRDREIVNAVNDLQVMHIRTEGRRQAEEELGLSLRKVLSIKDLSQEALALRVFQAIENVAADPKTRELLPSDTINMMRSVHMWLMPEDEPKFIKQTPPDSPAGSEVNK